MADWWFCLCFLAAFGLWKQNWLHEWKWMYTRSTRRWRTTVYFYWHKLGLITTCQTLLLGELVEVDSCSQLNIVLYAGTSLISICIFHIVLIFFYLWLYCKLLRKNLAPQQHKFSHFPLTPEVISLYFNETATIHGNYFKTLNFTLSAEIFRSGSVKLNLWNVAQTNGKIHLHLRAQRELGCRAEIKHQLEQKYQTLSECWNKGWWNTLSDESYIIPR